MLKFYIFYIPFSLLFSLIIIKIEKKNASGKIRTCDVFLNFEDNALPGCATEAPDILK